MNSRERDFRTKKEVDHDPSYNKLPRITPSSRQWSSNKNPRIVRVSRTFGGKDRHSKVCTVRGLRDRRIRLSVSTAIQLYDLQDRLGLGQPSKVVDWLLDATKIDIDKLPPLPMLPANFTQESPPNPQSHFLSSSHQNSRYLELAKEAILQENQGGFGGIVAQLSSQNQLFPLNNQFSFPNMPYNNSYFHNWDPPSLSLSHIGGGYPVPNQSEDQSHNNLLIPSTSQLYFRPSATTIPSIIPSFPSYINPLMDSDWRKINNLQNPLLPTTLHLISPPLKPFTLNSSSKPVHLHQNDNEKREKNKRS